MGYINNTAQWDKKRADRNGKLYGTIDFDINEKLSQTIFEKVELKPVVGTLEIGQKRFDMTYQEMDLLTETIAEAKKVIQMRYKMGMMR